MRTSPVMLRSNDQSVLPPASEVARERFLGHVREVGTMEVQEAARPFEAVPPAQLDAFREMLALEGAGPTAVERLATLAATIAPPPGDPTSRVTQAARRGGYITSRERVTPRTFRRVQSAVLGAGALRLWDFPRVDAARHWRHGHVTGLIALIACEQHPTLCGRAYAAGLLHDVGSLAMARLGIREDRASPDDREQAFYRAAMGTAVTARLGFPHWLRSTLLPCGIDPYVDDELECMVSAACRVAHLAGSPSLLTNQDHSFATMPDVEIVIEALTDDGGWNWLLSIALSR